MDETRPFPVACDWCATPLLGQIRREQAGKMVVVQIEHLDPAGRPCQGSGRGVPIWPLNLELRALDSGYELRIGRGDRIAFPDPLTLLLRLQELGLDQAEALRRVASVKPGEPCSFDVPERRRETRKSGVKLP